MKNIIEQIFSEYTKGFDYVIIGNRMIIKIDEDRRIEVDFCHTHVLDKYNALRIVLTSKTHGNINSRTIHFSDLFNCIQDMTHPNKIGKYIWSNNGKYEWYGLPTSKDIKALQNTLKEYINIWE